jgi:hypothetical protein
MRRWFTRKSRLHGSKTEMSNREAAWTGCKVWWLGWRPIFSLPEISAKKQQVFGTHTNKPPIAWGLFLDLPWYIHGCRWRFSGKFRRQGFGTWPLLVFEGALGPLGSWNKVLDGGVLVVNPMEIPCVALLKIPSKWCWFRSTDCFPSIVETDCRHLASLYSKRGWKHQPAKGNLVTCLLPVAYCLIAGPTLMVVCFVLNPSMVRHMHLYV